MSLLLLIHESMSLTQPDSCLTPWLLSSLSLSLLAASLTALCPSIEFNYFSSALRCWLVWWAGGGGRGMGPAGDGWVGEWGGYTLVTDTNSRWMSGDGIMFRAAYRSNYYL